MAIKDIEIEIGGITHTVQVNDDDKNYPVRALRETEEKAKTPQNKARTPSNKAAKPAADKAVEAASDPDASE